MFYNQEGTYRWESFILYLQRLLNALKVLRSVRGNVIPSLKTPSPHFSPPVPDPSSLPQGGIGEQISPGGVELPPCSWRFLVPSVPFPERRWLCCPGLFPGPPACALVPGSISPGGFPGWLRRRSQPHHLICSLRSKFSRLHSSHTKWCQPRGRSHFAIL